MLIQVCRAKIHRVRVTDANLNYEGSVSISSELLAASGIRPYERVQVVNVNNGSRLETYAIEGDTGQVCLNGPAARMGQTGDIIIIIAYGFLNLEEAGSFQPVIVHVDESNRPRS
ncbi:MAG: aspartate 1-decarboxylase [Candidatus Zixiibacteriota bacterium]